MLVCLISERCESGPLISIKPTMSDVDNGSPVDEVCLLDMDACYETFDKDGDGQLNFDEFRLICKALFRNDKGHIYPLPEDRARHVFQIFDKNDDGFIDKEEFTFCWNHWIKVIVRPVSAFLVVDVQNDFISGTLNISKCNAQQDGSEVVEPINRLLETVPFECVFYSLDWHPPDHVSFIDNVHMRELHVSSPVLDGAVKVYKGTNSEVDSYSVFWDNKKLTDTNLSMQLRARGVTDIYICGLAYDVCVGATIADALAIGYRSVLVDDASRGVDLADIEKTKATILTNHGVIVDSEQVLAMVEGRDRRPELGYKLAMELKHAMEDQD
ncbi:PREDICTED: uncharacterized protein LOC106122285 isoform X2 [Papilio xuthus]|uniref:nicotinamidase n=1 Tax=Papilio xuthus TaxID=66420 RepID=A0AAJ6ZJ82_PAPXU|nr:PREDICTED: uncharacterized protein LOC106122285 isoform X2 [Papilio xuthus]